MPRRSRTVFAMFVPALRHRQSTDPAPQIALYSPAFGSIRPFLSMHALSSMAGLSAILVAASGLGFVTFPATPAHGRKIRRHRHRRESSGRVLFARNADKARYPASSYQDHDPLSVVRRAGITGACTMQTKNAACQRRVAAGRSPSKLYLKAGAEHHRASKPSTR